MRVVKISMGSTPATSGYGQTSTRANRFADPIAADVMTRSGQAPSSLQSSRELIGVVSGLQKTIARFRGLDQVSSLPQQ